MKINTSTFSVISSITLSGSANGAVRSSCIDTANGFYYVARDSDPVEIIKINTGTFTEVGTTTLGAGQTKPYDYNSKLKKIKLRLEVLLLL